MDRSVPTSSKLITKRINDRNRQIHLAKLSNIKSTISREPPQSFNHMKSNKKKNQIAEDRLSEIERENKILLDKMTAIMKAGQPQVAATPVQTLERSTHKSLNVNYRKRELVKIAMENQSIMRRLQDQKPIYKRQQWEESRKQHELYLKNICEYPSTVGLPFIRPSEDSDGRPQTFQVTRGNIHALVSPKTAEKFYSPPRETNLSKSTIVRRNTEKLDPLNSSANQKTILYQTKKKIGLNNYLIHVYLNNDVFNIMASNNDRGDVKVLSIPINEGEDLVRRFGSNYKELVNRIRFKGSKIVFESNSMTFDPNDRTNSQLVTNDGIVETDDENEGDANTSNRKLNSNAGQNATHKSAPEIQEKSPKIRTVTPDEDKRVPQPVQASVKEETAQVKKEVQAKEEEPSKPKTPVVTNESKSHEEKSVTAEEKKVESKKSIQKDEGEGGSEKEEEKEKSNHSEVHESVNEKKEESVKDSKSQEQQIEESADYAESREDQEKIKESTSQAKEASEIKEQSEDENKEEPVEDAAISEEYQSKEQSN